MNSLEFLEFFAKFKRKKIKIPDKLFCWHGTNKQNADKIKKEGFNEGSYFARHLEDALTFGGLYVFRVEFDPNEFYIHKQTVPLSEIEWQFHITKRVLPDKIESLIKYSKHEIKLNK